MGNVSMLTSVLEEVEPALIKLDMDHKLFFVLTLLDEHPHPADLADCLLMPRPTVTAMIKRAEAAGFVKREGVASDLRKFKLMLTPAGRTAVSKGRQLVDGVFARRLSRLQPAELTMFAKLVERLGGDAC